MHIVLQLFENRSFSLQHQPRCFYTTLFHADYCKPWSPKTCFTNTPSGPFYQSRRTKIVPRNLLYQYNVCYRMYHQLAQRQIHVCSCRLWLKPLTTPRTFIYVFLLITCFRVVWFDNRQNISCVTVIHLLSLKNLRQREKRFRMYVKPVLFIRITTHENKIAHIVFNI